jgi:hypothetical protein
MTHRQFRLIDQHDTMDETAERLSQSVEIGTVAPFHG